MTIKKWEKKEGTQHLYQYLQIPEETKCICAVGSGGKTSLLYHLAGEYRALGKRVLLCTTTKMFRPVLDYVSDEEPEKIRERLYEKGFVVAGKTEESAEKQIKREKFGPLEADVWKRIYPEAQIVLVEADGSKGLPLKMPADYEPVLPKECEFMIAVSGLSGIGKPLKEICHRSVLAEAVLAMDGDRTVTEQDVVRLLRAGYEKFLRNKKGCFYFNQADCVHLQQLEIIKTALKNDSLFTGTFF